MKANEVADWSRAFHRRLVRGLKGGRSPRRLAHAISLFCLSLAPASSLAQSSTTVVTTSPGQITKILSDWNSNALLVALGPNVPFTNPAGCSFADYYETNPNDAGATLNQSMLLTAYTSHASLALVIQGCSFSGRPHIISVTMPN